MVLICINSHSIQWPYARATNNYVMQIFSKRAITSDSRKNGHLDFDWDRVVVIVLIDIVILLP